MSQKPITKEKALDRLASLCSRSEQCEFDLNRKLINWGISNSDRKVVIDYLKENRFIDDARYAKSFTYDKARFSYWGPYKIQFELSRRKINPQFIKEAINHVNQTIWKEGLLHNAESKGKTLDLIGINSYQERQKLFRYLVNRGFPSNASSKAVGIMKRRQEES